MKKTSKSLLIAVLMMSFCGTIEAQYHGGPRPHRSHPQRSVYRAPQPRYYNPGYATQSTWVTEITEVGFTFGMGDFNDAGHLSIYESVLMQVHPMFGIGMGAGVHYFVDAEVYNVPLYGLLRISSQGESVGVFVDCKVGYSVGDVRGFFLSPSMGLRFGYTNAVTLSVGYEMQKFSVRDNFNTIQRYTINGLSLKVGFEL